MSPIRPSTRAWRLYCLSSTAIRTGVVILNFKLAPRNDG